ncbi:MAG: glycosyltransferase [Proteobacteria bacterium]|nr:glycosyltransferase [Pseudomonadota bacterium]
MTNQPIHDGPLGPEPYLSVVIPVYNEQENLEELNRRLTAALDQAGYSYEIIYVNDGSQDESSDILARLHDEHQGRVRVIDLTRNFGQHMAVFAGFEVVRGQVVATLDADLQNYPEDVPILVARLEEGFDVVGGARQNRRDSWFRRLPSKMVNLVFGLVTRVRMKDYGCMLRAYRRHVVESMNQCVETHTYIPALANTFAQRVDEIPVRHAPRQGGESKYSLLKLLRQSFDLMTGFSFLPIHLVSLMGLLVALLGLGFGVFLFVRRLVVGPEVEGVFTLFAILFVFVGLQLLALGLLGEYVGRIYREVRRRPRYVVRRRLD